MSKVKKQEYQLDSKTKHKAALFSLREHVISLYCYFSDLEKQLEETIKTVKEYEIDFIFVGD